MKDESQVVSSSMQDEQTRKILNRHLDMEGGRITERGWTEITDILQVYSDKRFETARYLFVRDGRIMRHVAISCQNPTATISKFDEDFLFKLKTYADGEDTSIVFVHNHPSGYVVPSLADISTTNYIGNFFGERFAGHIILDHGNFGIYHPDHKEWSLMIKGKFYGIEEGEYMLDIGDSRLGIGQLRGRADLRQLADYARLVDDGNSWNRNKWIPSFYITQSGFVQSLEFIMNEGFEKKNYEATKKQIKNSGREAGCNHVIFVPKTYHQKLLCEAFAQKSGMVKDILYEKNDGTFELSNYHSGDIFNTLTKEEIIMSDQILEEQERVESVEEKISMDQYESHEQMAEALDDYIEMIDANRGMSERMMEDEIALEEEMESLDEYYDQEIEDISVQQEDTRKDEMALEEELESLDEYHRKEEREENLNVDIPSDPEQVNSDNIQNRAEEDKVQEGQEEEYPTVDQQESPKIGEMTLEDELREARAKIDRLEEQISRLIKAQEQLTQQYYAVMDENRMLKGMEPDSPSPKEIREGQSEQAMYVEEGQDRGSSKTFNSQSAYQVNCPVPPFGHEQEDGSIMIIKNAHFAKRLLNEYDSSQNKVVLTYADETGKTHELKMDEFDYQKMVKANEEYERSKNEVVKDSYEWLLYSERYDQAMKTDQNKMRLNFASNFIHNYRILCKLNATNPQQAMDQASQLYENMSEYEKAAFRKMRKDMGKKEFDDLLLKEFKDHTQGVENKNSLVLNNNELLYDVNKKQFELEMGERIGESNLHVGDTIKMAFKVKNIDGKSVSTPKLEFKILKATKNIKPEMAIVYNDEEKLTYQVPIKDLVRHQQKVRKQDEREAKVDLYKDNKKYGYTGRYM